MKVFGIFIEHVWERGLHLTGGSVGLIMCLAWLLVTQAQVRAHTVKTAVAKILLFLS